MVSISLDMLTELPSPLPTQPDEEAFAKPGRKRKAGLANSSSSRRPKTMASSTKTSKDSTPELDDPSALDSERLDFTVPNETTGEEENAKDSSPDPTSSRQKRKCVAKREKYTKLQKISDKNQKTETISAPGRKKKVSPSALALSDEEEDSEIVVPVLPASKPAPRKNKFPFSSSRSRRHRRKREEPLWQSASQKGGRFTRNAKCKAVYVFSTHLANEAAKAVMSKSHKTIIRYHEQFASKAGFLHKLPQHKRLMQFNSSTSPPQKGAKAGQKSLSRSAAGASAKGRPKANRKQDEVDFDDNDLQEDEDNQSSSSDNSDSDSNSNSSSSHTTNPNPRHFSASSELDSRDPRGHIHDHISPPSSPELSNPVQSRPRWGEAKSLFASRTEELLRAAEMAQQGELQSLDAGSKSEQGTWSKEARFNQDTQSSPARQQHHGSRHSSTGHEEQPFSSFRSPESSRQRNHSAAIDVGSPDDVAQMLSSSRQGSTSPNEAYIKPAGPMLVGSGLREEDEAEEEPNSAVDSSQSYLIPDNPLTGIASTAQYQPQQQPAEASSQSADASRPLLEMSLQTTQPQQQSDEQHMLHKQTPAAVKQQTLHHLPPPSHSSAPTPGQPGGVLTSSYEPRLLQSFNQHQQQKETEKYYPYPPYHLPSLPTHQQTPQQSGSAYKYHPPHYPWAGHYPYFPAGGSGAISNQPIIQQQKTQQAQQQLPKGQERQQSAAVTGISSPHLGQRSGIEASAAGHHALSHGPGGLPGASPIMHTPTQHMSPAHLQQYMMGGPATMMQQEHYLTQAAYGYDQNQQQQALQFWQQQQQKQQQQQQQYTGGLSHGLHTAATGGAQHARHPLGHTAGLWPTHQHLQQASQFGKTPLFSGQPDAAKPQEALFRLPANQNNNNKSTMQLGQMYMGYATQLQRPDLLVKDTRDPEGWHVPILRASQYQNDVSKTPAAAMGRLQSRNSGQGQKEAPGKMADSLGTDVEQVAASSSCLPTSAILEQARRQSELLHSGTSTVTTASNS